LQFEEQLSDSVKETKYFTTDLLSLGFFVIHNTLIGCQNYISELTGGQNAVGEILEILQLKIKSRGDNTALVKASIQVNNNFTGASIINNSKLVDVAFSLHQTEDFDEDFGDGVKDHLNYTLNEF